MGVVDERDAGEVDGRLTTQIAVEVWQGGRSEGENRWSCCAAGGEFESAE